MRTLIIQSYRTNDVPGWIGRCLASVRAWASTKGHDYRLTDDSVFALCGEEYLRKVGDNKRSITNLCRLELIKRAFAEGYDCAIWIDADVFVFAPEKLDFAPPDRINFARETWLWPSDNGWRVTRTLNNCVIVCPSNDADLDLVIQATRHRAKHHQVTHNFQVGVNLVRGLHMFLDFPLLSNVGMFSNHFLVALAQNQQPLIREQAIHHRTPVYAANICASDHLSPPVPQAMANAVLDLLERSGGEVINAHLLAQKGKA